MVRGIRAHIRCNVVGYVALFLALSGGTAYALDGSNTVFSDDIVNGEVQNPDLAADSVGSGKVVDNHLRSADIADDSTPYALTGADIATNSLGGADVGPDAIGGDEVFNNSLSGNDIAESTLGQVPSAATATTANTANRAYSTYYDNRIPFPNSISDPLNPIMRLNVPAGSYVVFSKLWAENQSGAEAYAGQCRLTAGADFDRTGWDVDDWINSIEDSKEVVTNLVVHTFASPSRNQVTLSCTDNGHGAVGAWDTKITAIQIASLSNVPFSR